VNAADCSLSEDVGAAELKVLWRDPEFEEDVEAFYYLRALENPSCRWSTWDALRAGVEPRSDLPRTIQERAWSSPIWYRAPVRRE
jgi:plasmid stabilization system protein ParE